MPLNAFGGGFDGAHLPTAGVDRIEVVRGPQSAVFGSGAIGGVVNVITRTGGPTGRERAGGRRIGRATSRVTGSASGSHDAWFWGAAFESLKTDGDTSFRDSIGGPVSNDDYERLAFSGSGGWSDRATRRFVVDARFTRDERGNPGPYGSDPFGLYSGLDTISRGINDGRGVGGIRDSRRHAPIPAHGHRCVDGRAEHVREPVSASPTIATRRVLRPVSGRFRAACGRLFRRRRAYARAGRQHVRDRPDVHAHPGGAKPRRLLRRNALDAGRARRRHRRPSCRSHRAQRLEGDAFGSRPPFDDNIVWSLNPKVSAAWYLAGSPIDGCRERLDQNPRRRRHGHQAAHGVRDCVHRQSVAQARAQPQHGSRPRTRVSRRLGVVADVTYFANRYDDLIVAVGTLVRRREPVPDGQHREREREGRGTRRALAVTLRRVGARRLSPGSTPRCSASTISRTSRSRRTPWAIPLIRRPRHQGSLDVRYARNRAAAAIWP